MGGSVRSGRTAGAARLTVVVEAASPCTVLAGLVGSGPAAVQAAILNFTSGTYAVKGVKGTLDLTFGSGKKAITVKGPWNCRS
jgi:hypothetical protein